MTCRHCAHIGTRLVTFSHDPQLLLRAPAATPIPRPQNLNRPVRRRLKLDLKQRLKVTTSAQQPSYNKARLTGRLRRPYTEIGEKVQNLL